MMVFSEENKAKLRARNTLACGDLLLACRLCRSLSLISGRGVVAGPG